MNDNTDKFPNKRRFPGGISAPAPKIKRKRQSLPEPKSLKSNPPPSLAQNSLSYQKNLLQDSNSELSDNSSLNSNDLKLESPHTKQEDSSSNSAQNNSDSQSVTENEDSVVSFNSRNCDNSINKSLNDYERTNSLIFDYKRSLSDKNNKIIRNSECIQNCDERKEIDETNRNKRKRDDSFSELVKLEPKNKFSLIDTKNSSQCNKVQLDEENKLNYTPSSSLINTENQVQDENLLNKYNSSLENTNSINIDNIDSLQIKNDKIEPLKIDNKSDLDPDSKHEEKTIDSLKSKSVEFANVENLKSEITDKSLSKIVNVNSKFSSLDESCVSAEKLLPTDIANSNSKNNESVLLNQNFDSEKKHKELVEESGSKSIENDCDTSVDNDSSKLNSSATSDDFVSLNDSVGSEGSFSKIKSLKVSNIENLNGTFLEEELDDTKKGSLLGEESAVGQEMRKKFKKKKTKKKSKNKKEGKKRMKKKIKNKKLKKFRNEKVVKMVEVSDKSNETKKMSSDKEKDISTEEKKVVKTMSITAKPKVKNLRKNIRDIMGEEKLEENTLAAQKEEQMRLQRLKEKEKALQEYIEQQQEERLVAEVAEAAEIAAENVDIKSEEDEEVKVKDEIVEDDIVVLSSEDEKYDDFEDKDEIKLKSSDKEASIDSVDDEKHDSDSDIQVLSHSESEAEELEDVTSSGAHIDDQFNVPDAQGRVLVNVGHPDNEEDIFLAQQLAYAVKPHQIGGIRFLYDNIVESVEQYKTSNGFGCILAHHMGLGKTLQVVAFTDIFLRHVEAKWVLIIVPINTIQNWLCEYNQWLSAQRPADLPDNVEFRCRDFKVFLLNDIQKTMSSRAKVIREWHNVGGVLLMGYELYRQLSLKKPKKKKNKRNKFVEEEEYVGSEKNKRLLDEMYEALVRPGPDLVICDEGHRIKNASAHISQALKNVRTKRRVVLTGYPLQNNLIEYWCMVDFIRPNYLGTKNEFCNMFERPIQNGQCVDSTPRDVKIMRYRSHVLHSLLEGFVQRRGPSVLAGALPSKQEHVLLCKMTKFQRKVYNTYMKEIKGNKSTANPLKAFAICCKIWNHPDVLYNFVKRRINIDIDLDIDEVLGPRGRSRKGQKFDASKFHDMSSDFSQPPTAPTSIPNWAGTTPASSRSGSSISQSPTTALPRIGMPGAMSQQMHPSMQHMSQMISNSDNQFNMGYGMSGGSMYNMQQNYMSQMSSSSYPWAYNQNFSNSSENDMQNFGSNNSYASTYGLSPYQQSPVRSHQLSMSQQQNINPNSSMDMGMSHGMSDHTGLGTPPGAHMSSNSGPSLEMHQQSTALNLSQHTNNPITQNLSLQSNQNNQFPNSSNQSMLTQTSQNLPDINQSTDFNTNLIPNLKKESLYEPNQESISDLLGQNMKDLGIEEKNTIKNEGLNSAPLFYGLNRTSGGMLIDNSTNKNENFNLNSSEKLKIDGDKNDPDVKNEVKNNEKMEVEKAGDDNKSGDKDKKEKVELCLDWAESLFKDYVPGRLETSSKFQIFFKILEGVLKAGDRLLVFSQSLFTLSKLEEFLQRDVIVGTSERWAKHRSYFRLDGSTSAQDREKLIQEFNSNSAVRLFLISTRAGGLGINLVGANRVIVFDASFNPCHDTQAVCRVYRYGQQKPVHIYRLVTDNSLERKIYDRQVNKQGISDRIVDEMNPDAHLSSKEIGNLLADSDEEVLEDEEDIKSDEVKFDDYVLQEIIKEKSCMFTRLPFQHESLLVDRKDKKLSNAEKRLAKRSYELEKQANISFGRPLPYKGVTAGKIRYGKSIGGVRPMQFEMGQKIGAGGVMMQRPMTSRGATAAENLAKQGVSVQQVTVPKDVTIPTNSGDGKTIQLKSGQSVMVIKTQKGMYLRLTDGKIVAIRAPPESLGLPLNTGSVTIVPTMLGRGRVRGRGRGYPVLPARRGRPPMAGHSSLPYMVRGGLGKTGNMGVRIVRKSLMNNRGGKSFQSVTVPATGGQSAILNKSVVITPAKPSSVTQLAKDLKISSTVQITPVLPNKGPSGSIPKAKSHMTSIAGSSGLTKRLNKNNKFLAKIDEKKLKEKEEMEQESEKKEDQNKLDSETSNNNEVKNKELNQESRTSEELLNKDDADEKEEKHDNFDEEMKNLEQNKITQETIVKNQPIFESPKLNEENSTQISPLQGLSKLIPPSDISSMIPRCQPTFTSPVAPLYNVQTPLFQPFLQSDSQPSQDHSQASQERRVSSQDSRRVPSQDVRHSSEDARQSSQDMRQQASLDHLGLSPQNMRQQASQDLRMSSQNMRQVSLDLGLSPQDMRQQASQDLRTSSQNMRQASLDLGLSPQDMRQQTSLDLGLSPQDMRQQTSLNLGLSPQDIRQKASQISSQNMRQLSQDSRISSQNMRQLSQDSRIPSQNTRPQSSQDSRIASQNIRQHTPQNSRVSSQNTRPHPSHYMRKPGQEKILLSAEELRRVQSSQDKSWNKTDKSSTSSSPKLSVSTSADSTENVSSNTLYSSSSSTAPQPSYSINRNATTQSTPQSHYSTQNVESRSRNSSYSTQNAASSILDHSSQQQSILPSFSSMNDSQAISQSHLSNLALSNSVSLARSESPLNLSNLLSNQSFTPQQTLAPDELLSHHSALDYLNYSLTGSSSAFRRPDFSSALPAEIQNLLGPPASTNNSPSISSATSVVSSPYSQYATAYRNQTTAPNFRTSTALPPGYTYPSQYSAYAGQYPNLGNLSAAGISQSAAMSQFGALQSTSNPYQTYPPPPSGSSISPYTTGLGGFSHGPYPPM